MDLIDEQDQWEVQVASRLALPGQQEAHPAGGQSIAWITARWSLPQAGCQGVTSAHHHQAVMVADARYADQDRPFIVMLIVLLPQ